MTEYHYTYMLSDAATGAHHYAGCSRELKKPDEIKVALKGLFSGQTKANKSEPKLDDIFKPENVDLIAWEYVSR